MTPRGVGVSARGVTLHDDTTIATETTRMAHRILDAILDDRQRPNVPTVTKMKKHPSYRPGLGLLSDGCFVSRNLIGTEGVL